MIDIEIAKNYFQNHLLGELFLESSPEKMISALRMAEQDIGSQLLFPVDTAQPCYIAAVCEQAVYLLTSGDELTANRILLSETVEGLGSRSYAANQDHRSACLAPRARLYLAHLTESGSVTLARG